MSDIEERRSEVRVEPRWIETPGFACAGDPRELLRDVIADISRRRDEDEHDALAYICGRFDEDPFPTLDELRADYVARRDEIWEWADEGRRSEDEALVRAQCVYDSLTRALGATIDRISLTVGDRHEEESE